MINFTVFDSIVYAVSVLFVVISAVYFYFQSQYQYWDQKKIPHSKAVFPFGSLKGIYKQNISVIFRNLYNEAKHEKVYGVWNFYRPGLLLIDPDLIKSILITDFEYFTDRGLYYNEEVDPLSGIFLST